jgi:hypothetical protein
MEEYLRSLIIDFALAMQLELYDADEARRTGKDG